MCIVAPLLILACSLRSCACLCVKHACPLPSACLPQDVAGLAAFVPLCSERNKCCVSEHTATHVWRAPYACMASFCNQTVGMKRPAAAAAWATCGVDASVRYSAEAAVQTNQLTPCTAHISASAVTQAVHLSPQSYTTASRPWVAGSIICCMRHLKAKVQHTKATSPSVAATASAEFILVTVAIAWVIHRSRSTNAHAAHSACM